METDTMKPDRFATVMAVLILALMVSHLSQDVVYGYEPARLTILAAAPVAAAWFYATVALSGRRSGYVLLSFGSFLAAIVSIVHMSGSGVREEVVRSSGGFFFIWALIALAMSAAVAILLSIHGLWRIKSSMLGFILSASAAIVPGGALLFYLVTLRA
jgi:hypothetical protein